MALILAIEPDQRQAAHITGIARQRLDAELVLADTTERALDAIGDRVPDLVLIPALLSPQDDAALAAALRVIAAAANVRTLTIPVLASAAPRPARRAVFGRWRRSSEPTASDGCDPAVFAEQVSTYLAEAVAERAARQPQPSTEALNDGTFGDDVFFDPAPAAAVDPTPRVALEPLTAYAFEPLPAIASEPPPTLTLEATPAFAFESTPTAMVPPAATPIFEATLSSLFLPAEPGVSVEAAAEFERPATPVITPVVEGIVETAARPSFDASAIVDTYTTTESISIDTAGAPSAESPSHTIVEDPEQTNLEPMFARVDTAHYDVVYAPISTSVEATIEAVADPLPAVDAEPSIDAVVQAAAPVDIETPVRAIVESSEVSFEATEFAIVNTSDVVPDATLDVAAAVAAQSDIALEHASELAVTVEPVVSSLTDDVTAAGNVEPETITDEPFVAAASAVAPLAVEQSVAANEATILEFHPVASSIVVGVEANVVGDDVATAPAEGLTEQATVETERAQALIDEEAAILAEFLGESDEATILAFHLIASQPDRKHVNAFAEMGEDEAAAVGDRSASLEHSAAFDEPDASDIIEIDLSDETLGHAFDEEPVFELTVDDGDDAFAIAEIPARVVSPVAAVAASVQPSSEVTLEHGAAVSDEARLLDGIALAETLDDSRFDAVESTSDLELWMPLSVGFAHLWPVMEGVASEYVDLFAVAAPPPAPPKSEHPEWTELIASLRQDMERRREAVEPTPITRVVPRRKAKPVQDEWGFFDPQQCGFAALLAKLDEITESNEEPASRLA